MIPKPTLHPLAERHLRELRAHGVEPSLEESLWIVQLCDKVLNPYAGERLDLIGTPQRCGSSDVWLWPMTIGSAFWYQDFACEWWKGETEPLFWALAFSLAHAREKRVFTEYCRTREGATGMIRDWTLSLCCERPELEEALDAVLPQVRQTSEEPKPVDWQLLVGTLEAITGIPCEYWVWEVSRDQTVRSWYHASSVAAARSDMPACPIPDAADQALKDLAEAKASIVASRKAVFL